MSAGMTPEEMVCESEAPRIDSGDGRSRQVNHVRSDRLLIELTRFVQGVSEDGVSSPFDAALLDGAKLVFKSMIRICEEASKKSSAESQPSRSQDVKTMSSMSIASFGPESLCESGSPDGVEKSTKESVAKAKTQRKKRETAKEKTPDKKKPARGRKKKD